ELARVMRAVLVSAEALADLDDPLEARGEQALHLVLGRGDEKSRSSGHGIEVDLETRTGNQQWRFDFDEVARREELSHRGQRLRARGDLLHPATRHACDFRREIGIRPALEAPHQLIAIDEVAWSKSGIVSGCAVEVLDTHDRDVPALAAHDGHVAIDFEDASTSHRATTGLI